MKNHIDLTSKQNIILHYLDKHIRVHGKIPTLREAAEANHVSHAAIAQTLKALERKGFIKREGKYSRTIRILREDGGNAETGIEGRIIPIIGSIAAGLPLYAQQEWEKTVVVDPQVFKGDHLFALRIKGDSMKDAGILDGDVVICEPRQFAKNGEIVAALINHEEATVKRFYLRKSHIELIPENPEFKPVKYRLGEVLVQGKVIGLIREAWAFGA